jgi:hypothetical protein
MSACATVYVVRWYRAVLVVGSWAPLLLTLSMLAGATENSAAMAYLSGATSLLAYPAIRSFRAASVTLNVDEVAIHGLLRTRRIPWTKVCSVGVTGGSTLMLAWRVPFFALNDGSAVRADELRARAEPSIVDAVVADAQMRLAPRSAASL